MFLDFWNGVSAKCFWDLACSQPGVWEELRGYASMVQWPLIGIGHYTAVLWGGYKYNVSGKRFESSQDNVSLKRVNVLRPLKIMCLPNWQTL